MMGTAALALSCGVDDSAAGSDSASVTKTEGALCGSGAGLDENTRFFVPPPNDGAVEQAAALRKAHNRTDAALIRTMARTPQAVWFTSGTPREVKKAVKKTMSAAAADGRVPVLVAYNIPFRDCAQYSAGGALDAASYRAWIDGFAAGIGPDTALVVLEPDGLGIIPFSGDWCQPTVTDAAGNTVPAPGADPATRYALLNYAVDKLASEAPNALVYLDATHNGWLNVGDAASRLSQAGVARARGFFLNISNYQFTANLTQYGTWIASCLAYATSIAPGDFGSCPNQYWNGAPLPSKIAQLSGEWTGVALDAGGEWSDTTDTAALNTSGVNLRYANMLGATQPVAHFIIDTSRNGRGPLNVAPYGAAPYNQPGGVLAALNGGNWCNPAGAGLGAPPTARPGGELLDAYLWVKIPGESDGSCDIAGGARAWDFNAYNPWLVPAETQNHFDPLWGITDPAAGLWFPQQALELVQLANPPLR